MTAPLHPDRFAPASVDIGEPVIVYNPVAARRWLLDGAADEHGIDESFTTTELTIAARLEELLSALADDAVAEVWTTRHPLIAVLIWRTADGDGIDGGAIITADLTINGQPIRLASRHQGFDNFTHHSATSGIDAAIEALGHIAALINHEADLLQRALRATADGAHEHGQEGAASSQVGNQPDAHRLLIDPTTREGLAIHELFMTIKNDIEDADGGWNGGDVVALLTRWFTALGYDVDAPAN